MSAAVPGRSEHVQIPLFQLWCSSLSWWLRRLGLGGLSCGTVESWCWCEIPGRSHVLNTWEGWRLISLCLLRDRHWADISVCVDHWIQEHSISKDLCLGSSSSFTYKVAFTWGFNKRSSVCRFFTGFVMWCTLRLVARSGLVSPLCISLLLLERGGEDSHSSLR